MNFNKRSIPENGSMLPLAEGFYSVQGEGFHSGKPAYFIRLGGCDIGCSWCDTRFSWNAAHHPLTSVEEIIVAVLKSNADTVVVTGGEPLIYNLDKLCKGLKENNVKIYLETSGAYPLTGQWDWICLSPKRNVPPMEEICALAHELKVIIRDNEDFEWAELYAGKVGQNCILYLQAEWSKYEQMIIPVVQYVKENKKWSVSLQSHKFMKIP